MPAMILPMLLVVVFSLIAACEQPQDNDAISEQLIAGRHLSEGAVRLPIYRVAAPTVWRLQAPPGDEAIEDTMQAIAEFFIADDAGEIRITLHNFPAASLESRIPPHTQIARWQRQFLYLDDAATTITPQAFSGFVGLLFDGRGTLASAPQAPTTTQPIRMLAWAMQLATEHWHTLDALQQPIDERRSDITIKAVGPEQALARQERRLLAFARSIELLDPLPLPL